MLTESRKRRRGRDNEEEEQRLNPQAKRPGGGHDLLVSDLGRDAWDSEQSSSSDSSGGISSPERGALASASPCTHSQNCVSQNSLSPQPEDSASASLQGFHGNSGGSSVSYYHINRVLREAHFSSLQTRGRPGST